MKGPVLKATHFSQRKPPWWNPIAKTCRHSLPLVETTPRSPERGQLMVLTYFLVGRSVNDGNQNQREKGSVNGIVIFSWRRKARSWFRARLGRPGARREAWGLKSACAFGRGDMSPGPKAASCRRTPKVGAIPGDGQTSLRDGEPCSRWFRGLKPHGYRQAVAPRLGAGMKAERG